VTVPDYMLMVLENEAEHAAQSPASMAELIQKRAEFAEGLRSAGQLRDHGRFRPSREGKRMRREAEGRRVQSGPFAEEGKALGGYYWVEAASVEDAAKLAGACPALASDQVDVRPLMKGRIDHDKDDKRGKIFGCVVLGNAVTEESWTKVMDCIDAETKDNLPDSFIGGVRLQPPTAGRRVAKRGERQAMFDGPFLESKEVIGGVFLIQAASIEHALEWVEKAKHGVHGELEIRELWRS